MTKKLYSFFYNYIGDNMVVYLDLVFILNLFFDLILLFSVAIILKRQTNLKKIFLGALLGSISIFSLFIDFNSIMLFIIKILIAFLMVVVTFGYRDFRYTLRNMMYLYIVSIVLGGFLYLCKVEFSYKKDGIIFYSDGLSINFYILIILSPIIIYVFVKQIKLLKNNYSNYYKIDIYLNNGQVISTTSFLDTGNNLFDPYKNRPIILVNKNIIKFNYDEENILFVPYDTLNNHGLLKCLRVNYIDILGIGIRKNVLIGISNQKIKIDGVDSILNKKILEEI